MTYTHYLNYVVKDNFECTIWKVMETNLCINATVMIVVGPGVKNQPIAKNDIATTNENNPVNIKILENDEDPNDETLNTRMCG